MYAGIFILIFALCVLLTGLYMFTGHKLNILTWRAAFKNLTIDKWKNIGKWTMISSLFIAIIGVILIILQVD